MTTESEKLLIRIKKLMRKADDPSVTPEEAETFAAKARQLLIEHKLSEESLRDVNIDRDPIKDYEKEKVKVAKRWHVATWKMDLFYGVAKYNFCQAVKVSYSEDADFHLIGKETDRQVALYIYDQLIATIEAMAKREADARVRTGELSWYLRGYKHPSKWMYSYSNGCVVGVLKKLKADQEAQKEEHGAVYALMVRNDRELMEATYKLIGGIRNVKVGGSRDSGTSAYQQGVQDGQGINYSRHGVGGSSASSKALPGRDK
jgi:hypothetical protein